MSVLVVIPARYGSTRLPGKPLATLGGKPMIQHVYERVAKAKGVREVVVATDDQRIADAVKGFKGTAVMTSATARSGTERVAEVARGRNDHVIINVQGDEPLIESDMVEQLAEYLGRHGAVPMASLMTAFVKEEDVTNPNAVKVVTDSDGFALYFSRAPIPYIRDGGQGAGDGGRGNAVPVPHAPRPTPPYRKHLGIYGYQRHFLLQFPALEPTTLEQLEQLEQLRALEHGHRIKLLETVHDTIGVDTLDDLRRVEQRLLGALR
jgi:3-deoxy-manno-octulosonate cytidylyltransferase (CMP-KDO synthetase)